MKRLIAASIASLALSAPAWAGFGATASMPVGGGGGGVSIDFGDLASGGGLSMPVALGGAPTFDFRNAKMLVQVPVLDIVTGLANEATQAGASFSYIVKSKEISKDTEGVVMPGASLAYVDGAGSAISLHTRIGGEIKQKGTGIGVYVVPKLNVTLPKEGDTSFAGAGAIEISGWFTP